MGARYQGTISRSYATGDVLGDGAGGTTNTVSGGFVGSHCQGVISSSFATGDVYGDSDIGGFGGMSHNCAGVISNSYARGNVYPSGPGTGGSFMRYIYLGTVSNSYATGSVDGQTNAGFIYYDNTCASCVNNFWDTQTSGQTTGGIFSNGRGTGKTTAQMKNVATFTTTGTAGLTSPWDFVGNPNNDTANNDYWNIDSAINDGYPYLAWYTPVNTAPTVTTLGPTSKVNGSWGNNGLVTLSFVTADSDGDAVQYRLQIDDSADFGSPIVDQTSVLATAGTKSFTVSEALASGSYYWRVKVIDSNGAESAYVAANGGGAAFKIDTIAPLSPDNPVRITDANDNTPTLEIAGSIDAGGSGLANPAYLIEWSQNSSFSSGVLSGTTNTTSYTISTPLADGRWYTRATAYDVAGNSTISDLGTFMIDTTAPILQSSSPVNNATSVSLNPILSLQFDQVIGTVTGDIVIRKASDNTIVETIPVGGGPVSGSGTNTILIDPFYPLEYDTTYYVEVASTAIDDLNRNYFSGISGDSQWRFTTLSRPVDPEVLVEKGSDTVAENGTKPVSFVTPTSSVSDQQIPVMLNDYSEFSQETGKQLSLTDGQVVYFMHQNERHSVTISFKSDGSVEITIASTPKIFQLSAGQSVTHDVDGDGRDDIKATYVGMSGDGAQFAFQQITETDDSEASNAEVVNALKAEVFDWVVVAIGGCIALVLGILFIVVRKRRMLMSS